MLKLKNQMFYNNFILYNYYRYMPSQIFKNPKNTKFQRKNHKSMKADRV